MKRSSIVRTSEEDQYGRCTCEDDHVKPTPVDVAIVESLERNLDNLDLELNFILNSEGCGEFFLHAFSS
jgi:hypothetical protein